MTSYRSILHNDSHGLARTRPFSSGLRLIFAIAVVVGPAANADEPEETAKRLVERLKQSEFSSVVKDFDSGMEKALPADKLEGVWKGVLQAAGAFRRQTDSRVDKTARYSIVHVTCEFEKAALDVRVVFDGQRRISGLFFVPSKPKVNYRPPVYADPKAFRESDVTLGHDPWKLPGTLSVPLGAGPFPAVLLVHGSGPNDRDETIGSNKPFKDLASGLASRGIAALRYDKRSKVHAHALAGVNSLTVNEEVVDDVFAAVDFLRRDPRIDPRRIFVAGHSLGGYLVPRIAAHKDGGLIAGFVILAGNTRPIEQLISEQTNHILSLAGALSDHDRQQVQVLRRLVDRVNDPALAKSDQSERLLGAPIAYWLDLRGYRPEQLAAAKLFQPTFILQGERDYQVTLTDFRIWNSALKSRKNVKFKTYPQLNHLFITGEGPSGPAEYEVAGNVAKEVVDDIAAWALSIRP